MIEFIYETEQTVRLLQKWNLVSQYKKVKNQICAQNFSGNRLKLRQPKSKGIHYFRVNKQYRAFAKKEGNSLVVFTIDNHS